MFAPTSTRGPGGALPTVVPDPIDVQKAGETGRRTLWLVSAIMLLSSLVIYVMAWRVPTNKRFFHIVTALITTVAAVAYYAMAAGDGIGWHYDVRHEEIVDPLPDLPYGLKRQVYWARYVDWAVTTPLVLVDLAVLVGLSGADLLVAVAADAVMVLTGLFAALGRSGDARVRWGYYAVGCVAFLVVAYQVAVGGWASARRRDKRTARVYRSLASFTLVLWTLYLIVWALADGTYTLSVDEEIVAYAVLDVLTKPVFGIWLLFAHDAMAESTLSLDGFWAHGVASEGAIRVGDDDDDGGA